MSENAPLVSLNSRIDAMERALHDLHVVFDTINHDLRADMHSTMTPIGVDLYEVHQTVRRLTELVQDISIRMGKLEMWASLQDAERHTRQRAIDDKLEEIIRKR